MRNIVGVGKHLMLPHQNVATIVNCNLKSSAFKFLERKYENSARFSTIQHHF